MLDTPPKILFCDLRLDPGESKTCKKLEINQTGLTFSLNDPSHFLLISALCCLHCLCPHNISNKK